MNTTAAGALVTVTINKPSPDTKLGLAIAVGPDREAYVKKFNPGCLFEGTELREGMAILYVNQTSCAGKSVNEILSLITSSPKTVSIVAKHKPGPTQHIIFKKTWKIKPAGFQVANEKSFTFHGQAMNDEIASYVQERWAKLHRINNAHKLVLTKEGAYGYRAQMNHDFQKYHEEDAVAAVFDAMATLGWEFKFQYDSEMNSVKLSGSSFSAREMFIFYKPMPLIFD